MTGRAYNTVANILMLVAVASALLFDSGRFPQMLAIVLGASAAIAGIVLYFLNQKSRGWADTPANHGGCGKEGEFSAGFHHAPEKEEKLKPVEKKREEFDVPVTRGGFAQTAPASPIKSVDVVAFGGERLPYLEKEWAAYEARTFRKEAARRFLKHYAAHHARSLQWQLVNGPDMALMKPEVELSPNEVAACAVEIIRSLSVSEGLGWDYSFGPNGLQVSIKKSRVTVAAVPQEGFEFDPILAHMIE